MKSLNGLLIVGSLVMSGLFPLTQAKAETQEKTLDQALQEIQHSQGIDEGKDIDCGKVTNKQLEEVGDGFMSVVHPNRQAHDFMDRMMGGEGSSSLAYMHRMMGARYLGCYDNDDSGWYGMGHMMGNGFGYGMGPAMMMYRYQADPDDRGKIIERGRTMMGYGYYPMGGWGMGWFMWVFWILIIAMLLMLLRHSGKCVHSTGEKPLDILKKRYAKGEVTKEEFDKMKKDLEA